jgi:murein DD-endopeptidase MepM/ murein hydrolase activator NlpD
VPTRAAGGGKGAQPSNGHPISDGDGIVVLRSLVDVGPFKKGLNFAYGHAENPQVKPGKVVEAGEVIAHAGFANAWHVHFMVNGRTDDRGVGDRDPMPFVEFAIDNS